MDLKIYPGQSVTRATQNKTKQEKAGSWKTSCVQQKTTKKHVAEPEPAAEQNTTHTN